MKRIALGAIGLILASESFALDYSYMVLLRQYDESGMNQLAAPVERPLSGGGYLYYNPTTNYPEWKGEVSMTMSANQIIDATSIGRDLMTATSASNARATIGAGTSNFSGSWSGLADAPTNLNQFTNGPGFVTASTAPVVSVNGSTGAVTLTASGIGAAALSHSHTSSQVSDSTVIGRNLLTAADQAAVKVLVGVPTQVSQLSNDSGYVTSSAVSGKLTGVKYTGSTNSSGIYTVTYGTAYGAKPTVLFAVEGGTNKDTSVLTSSSTTGFSILVERRSDVLGLLPTYAAVNSITVNAIVTP